MHFVPAATDMTTDQLPEAQRWKEVPLIQLYWPSFVQAPDWEPAPPVEGALLGVAGVDDDAGVEGGEGDDPEPPAADVAAGVAEVGEDPPVAVGEASGGEAEEAVGVAPGKSPAPVELAFGSDAEVAADDWGAGGATVAKTPPGRVEVAGEPPEPA